MILITMLMMVKDYTSEESEACGDSSPDLAEQSFGIQPLVILLKYQSYLI